MTESYKSHLLRPILTLVSGTGVGLVISYAARPVLTRLYSPEAFGILGVYIAIVAVLSTMSSLRYEDAIMTPESDEEAVPVLWLSLSITLVVALLAGILIPFRHQIADITGKPDIAPYLVAVPVGVFAMGWIRIIESWLTRRNKFGSISRGRVVSSATTAPVQLGARRLGDMAGGLVGGLVSGQVVALAFLSRLVWRSDRKLISENRSVGRIAETAKRYRRFPVFSLPAALLGVGSLHMAALVLFYFFNTGTVGHYAQAYGLLAAPIALLGGAVTQVYFVRSAEAIRHEGLDNLTSEVFGRLFGLGLFPILSVMIVGPDLFEVVLGPAFRESGIFAQRIAPWLLLVFASTPLTRLFDVLERQRAFLGFTAVNFLLRLMALIYGGLVDDPLLAVTLFGLASAVVLLLQAIWLLHLAEVSFTKLIRRLIHPILLTTAFLVCAWLATFLDWPPAATAVVETVLVLAYLGIDVARHGRIQKVG